MQHATTPATTWDELRTTQQGHTPDYGTWYGYDEGYEASMCANQRRHWQRQRAIRDGRQFDGLHSRRPVLFPLDRPCIPAEQTDAQSAA